MEEARTARTLVPRSAPFLLAALVCALGVAGTYLFFVRTTTGQYIDETAWEEAAPVKAAMGSGLRTYLDFLPYLCAVGGLVTIFLIALIARRWSAAGITVGGMLLANVATQVIKASLNRPDRGIETFDFNSLPSGHTTVAGSAAAAVFLMSSPRWRPLVGFLGATFTVGSGATLLINQWHRPADVLAGLLVVACFTCLTGWLVMKVGRTWNSLSAADSRFWAASRFWPVLCALLGLAAAVVAIVVTGTLTEPGTQRSVSYVASGVAVIILSGYVLCVAGTLLFGSVSRRTRPASQLIRSQVPS